MDKVIKFKQKDWLKSSTDMNTELKTKAKKRFEKGFLKLP